MHPLTTLLELEQVKPDAFMGDGPILGWHRLYGGQILAQALRAASLTVSPEFAPHSLHAYFVRQGSEKAPVLFEVDRVRDGRSFATRQVVAYQARGAILTLIASFQVNEDGLDRQLTAAPPAPDPTTLPPEPTDLSFDQRTIAREVEPEPRVLAWMRAAEPLGDDPIVHACALAYLSDEYPLGVAVMPQPHAPDWSDLMAASLDHAIWFHRPVRADEWLLFDLEGHGIVNSRGLSFARVFDASGCHVASVAQEGLARPLRSASR